MPSLIVGDVRSILTASVSTVSIDKEVRTDGLWHRRENPEYSQTMKFDAATIVAEDYQAGISIPFQKRERHFESAQGLGDISAHAGYEYWNDWEYHPIRPRGLAYLQIVAPTGPSAQELDTGYLLEARGRGFWALGLGTLLTKVVGRWDLYSHFQIHRSLDKEATISGSRVHITPGWGGFVEAGAGYNWSEWRVGAALRGLEEAPVGITGELQASGAVQRDTTAVLSASYLYDNAWTTTVSYTDQTWFGNPTFTTLGRGIAITLQRRWMR